MGKISYLVILSVFILVWLYLLLRIVENGTQTGYNNDGVKELSENLAVLKRLLDHERKELATLQEKLKQDISTELLIEDPRYSQRIWKEPIPVVVFVCNRPHAVKNHIDKLLRYRSSSTQFPIVVSQDCDNDDVQDVVKSFGSQIKYVKHISGEKANISVPPNHSQYVTYYRIARHYRLAMDYVFRKKGYSSVIMTEDDLDIAPDFFEYFSATRFLLREDPLLWCVSAWNDNGKTGNINATDNTKLYRSDFFPGLGWMMSSALWDEFEPIWPAGFWDDWMRDPLRRKGRQCIRPEISRTSMTTDGKVGASKGQFFNKHLAKIVLNNKPVEFTKMNLDYLLKENYDPQFNKAVFEQSKLVPIDEAVKLTMSPDKELNSLRVEYDGNIDYIKKADRLHIMHDFKAGVPRTAYMGTVTCFINGVRIYLTPNRQLVKEYDPTWEVPAQFGE